jgi:two-component system, OmpR family, phosphate regulon sensor histidine kinase PhoR
MARVVLFIAVGAVLSTLAWIGLGPHVAWASCALWAVAWIGYDAIQFHRFEELLKQGTTTKTLSGRWTELAGWLQRFTRKQSEQTVGANKKLTDFLHAIQVSPNAVVMLDEKKKITWANQQANNMLGVNGQTDLMQLVTNIVRNPEFIEYLQSGDFSHDCSFGSALGTPDKPLKLSLQVFEYGEGQSLLLARDITSIERAEATRRDFVANVSHEMRTPLTVIHGFIETLKSLPLDRAQQLKYLTTMGQQTTRMEALLADLLVLAKLDSETTAPMQEWSNLQSICSRVASVCQSLSANHHLQWSIMPGLELAGDEAQIESALSNLVNNAIRYSPEGSTVKIQTSTQNNADLIISVTDQGLGIAREHLPRITERFYRVDKNRSRDSGGTGLGLAIVKNILIRHDALLRVDSHLGDGSTFSIIWPSHRVRSQTLKAVA